MVVAKSLKTIPAIPFSNGVRCAVSISLPGYVSLAGEYFIVQTEVGYVSIQGIYHFGDSPICFFVYDQRRKWTN
jgi:hypothetical protein